MGRMWKYEPEDYDNSHLKGTQFKYQTPTTIDYETDNDGNPIYKEPKQTQGEKIAGFDMARRGLKGDHKFN